MEPNWTELEILGSVYILLFLIYAKIENAIRPSIFVVQIETGVSRNIILGDICYIFENISV